MNAKKSILRKSVLLFLSIAMLCLVAVLLSSCKAADDNKPLRVLVDLYHETPASDPATNPAEWLQPWGGRSALIEADVARLETLLEADGLENFEIEWVPDSGAERKSALTRVRTEMMSGEGPDVFIVQPHWAFNYVEDDSLFLIPQKSLELGLFYPLDDLLPKARHFSLEDTTEAIMDAGVSERFGRGILPLSYSLPLTVYRQEDVPELPEISTWQEMLEEENRLYQPGTAVYGLDNVVGNIDLCAYTFGDLTTFDENVGKLAFTEEELLARLRETQDQLTKYQQGELDDLPYYRSNFFGPDFEESCMKATVPTETETDSSHFNRIPDITLPSDIMLHPTEQALTFAPIYNEEGGVTASISLFAAINANTKSPERAFQVLDVLMSQEAMGKLLLYRSGTNVDTLSVREDVMTEETPYVEVGWFMHEQNLEAFAQVREKISHVFFESTLTMELERLQSLARASVPGGYAPDTDLAANVADAYSRMQKELDE